MRKTKEELDKLCNELNIDTLWSWSRYHCFKQDTYEYFLKYVLHEKEDRTNSIYTVSGGNIHDIIERFYNKEIRYEDMIDEYEDSLFTMNLSELKYDRNNNEKNSKIGDKYENCIRHFFKKHDAIKYHPFITEKFITIKISNNIYMQGYIDFMHIQIKRDNGKNYRKIYITDWKSSSIYKGKKIDEEAGQLLIYAEGIRQTLNVPLDQITIRWNFLKYVNVTYLQKNGKIKERCLERNVIGEGMVNTVKMWLKELGYEDSMDFYVEQMTVNNDIDCLPSEIRERFTIRDCYVEIELTKEKIDLLKQDIINTITDIKSKVELYNQTKDENIFWQEVTSADEYRLACLSSYSRNKHKPYDAYLKEKEMFMENVASNNQSEEDELIALLNNL